MEVSSTTPAPTRARKIDRPRPLKWRHHLAAFFMFAGLRALSWTWRLRLDDENNTLSSTRGPVIFCLWHNRLAISMRLWERFAKTATPAAGLVALISASHDGGIFARMVSYFGVETVRGSSSRRGAQALLELTSWTERGYAIAITPDGPRGPRYQIHEGAIALAQLSGQPIIPVSARIGWKVCLKSWDRFQVPFPFTRCDVRLGAPLTVPRDASEEQREALRVELQRRMMELTSD